MRRIGVATNDTLIVHQVVSERAVLDLGGVAVLWPRGHRMRLLRVRVWSRLHRPPPHLGSLPLRETTIRASVPAYPPVQRTTSQKLKKLIHEMFPAARPNQSTYGYSYYTVSMSDLPLGSAERVLKARPCRSGRTHTD